MIGVAERHHPRAETGRYGQRIGTVLERDQRAGFGRPEKAMHHPSGNLMVPSRTRLVSPAMTTVAPLSSHQRSPPRGESWRL